MLRFRRALILVTLGLVSPVLGLTGRAETISFAWPDGASAKVQARSEGRRTGAGKDITWDMSSEFTMQVRRAGDRVVVSRSGFNGWKGALPPSFGGGAERYTDMIPTFVVSGDGSFLGIEGQETARRLMNQSVEQSGGLDAASRNVFETMTTDAALRAMAADHWSVLVGLWEGVELDPESVYELRSVTAVPQLGGGELALNGEIRFVKETPCSPDAADARRCAHFHAESAADKAQIVKLLESLMKRAGAGSPVISGWEQRFKADIVIDKATTLPQRLTLTRIHAVEVTMQGRSERVAEEINKTYTFNWLPPAAAPKK